MTRPFVPGVELAERFHREVVGPQLRVALDGQPYSAALIGYGSEVQGFDTDRSTDHAWGPRMMIFLDEAVFGRMARDLDALLDRVLPDQFCGFPVRFAFPNGTPPRHWVQLAEPGAFFAAHLGSVPDESLPIAAWLTVPTQVLRELTGGQVFHDGLRVLRRYRQTLQWYPDDVWRYVLACQWQRLSQEEPFVGRCGEVGDDLGSAVVAARQVRDLMKLCLLMDRVYPPYSKWLGTAFAATTQAGRLTPHLTDAIAARTWRDRETELSAAYELLATMHNELGLTPPVDPHVRHFHDRPFQVLDAYRFADALMDTIADPHIRSLPLIGAIDQYVDSTEVLDRNSASARWQYVRGPAELLDS